MDGPAAVLLGLLEQRVRLLLVIVGVALAGCGHLRLGRHAEMERLCMQVHGIDLPPESCWTRSRMLHLAARDGLGVGDAVLVCIAKGDLRHAVVLYDGVVYDPESGEAAPWERLEERGWRVVECPEQRRSSGGRFDGTFR